MGRMQVLAVIFEKMSLGITGCSCLKHTTLANAQFWRLLERAVALDLARQRFIGAVTAGTRVIWMHWKDPMALAFLRTKAAVYIKDNGGTGFGMDLENFFGLTRFFGMKVLLLRTNFMEWADRTTAAMGVYSRIANLLMKIVNERILTCMWLHCC
jgi:hypothetical protein